MKSAEEHARDVIGKLDLDIDSQDPEFLALLELTAARDAEYAQERERLACGHPKELLIKSVESDYQYCELCNCKDERRDALQIEAHYKAQLAQAAERERAAVAAALRDIATIVEAELKTIKLP